MRDKSFKHMTAILKNFCFGVLDDMVNKYNKTVHRTIKIKPVDVTSDSYAEYNQNSNKKDSKFKVDDHVTISKYKNSFANGYASNSSEVFVLTESILEKELQKTSQKEFRIEKVLKRKGDEFYIKWKGYDSRIDKKDLV